jgi:hypothetical protein
VAKIADGVSSTFGSLVFWFFGFSLRGRTGFDRTLGSESGVPWLISWPRKKLITMLLVESNLALAA